MFSDNPVKEKIYSIIKNTAAENEYIDLTGSFEDIGIGSIDIIKIMVGIEEHYFIEIEEKYYINEEYENIECFINKMAEYVSVYMNNST